MLDEELGSDGQGCEGLETPAEARESCSGKGRLRGDDFGMQEKCNLPGQGSREQMKKVAQRTCETPSAEPYTEAKTDGWDYL